MQIYNYDPSGLYIDAVEADINPVTGGPVIPAFATTAQPPKTELGKAAYFVREQGKWEIRDTAQPLVAQAPQPAATTAKRVAMLRAMLSDYADATARGMGFDSMAEAVTYADEPAVPRFQTQGAALRAWRSLLWEAFEMMEARYLAGDLELPKESGEFFGGLPVFVDPLAEERTKNATPPADLPEPVEKPAPRKRTRKATASKAAENTEASDGSA